MYNICMYILFTQPCFKANFVSRSLGCMIYELVVGSPPFQTSSILHLVILIKFETIKWPDFISPNCKSFLQVTIPVSSINIHSIHCKFYCIQGLLQKQPSYRLTWPDLLEHPFVKDRIIIVDGTAPTPFTTPLSASQARAKEQQLQSLAMRSANHSKYNANDIVHSESISNIDESMHCEYIFFN